MPRYNLLPVLAPADPLLTFVRGGARSHYLTLSEILDIYSITRGTPGDASIKLASCRPVETVTFTRHGAFVFSLSGKIPPQSMILRVKTS